LDKYSFCESVTATGTSPWHIRKLTDKGRKRGGGADTPALCGRVVHWDRQVSINEITNVNSICKKCTEEYDKQKDI